MDKRRTRRAFAQDYIAVAVGAVAIPVLGAWKHYSESEKRKTPHEDGLVARVRRLLTLNLHARPPER